MIGKAGGSVLIIAFGIGLLWLAATGGLSRIEQALRVLKNGQQTPVSGATNGATVGTLPPLPPLPNLFGSTP